MYNLEKELLPTQTLEINQACRNRIIDILKYLGRPAQTEEITDLVLNKYPLIKKNLILYALKTSKEVVRISHNYYTLKIGNYLEVTTVENRAQISRVILAEKIVEILSNQAFPITIEELIIHLNNNYEYSFSVSDVKKISKILKELKAVYRTPDNEYYYLSEV